jgi:hypothetical protein
MAFKGATSIPARVDTLRSDPFFAILSGLIPACLGTSRIDGLTADPIPGVGTFYDLWIGAFFYVTLLSIEFFLIIPANFHLTKSVFRFYSR